MTSVTQQIKPPVLASTATQNFSDAKVEDQTGSNLSTDTKKTDFRTLITNSMDDVKKQRAAKENGDLTSTSDAEFLEKLADQSKEKRTPKNELGKDDFLKLFVTQLQNQDPMNPDDGTEMAAKLAQFNGLEQMMNVNKGIEKLIAAQGTDRNLSMMNYIGKEVTVDGGRVRLENGKPTKSEFTTELPIASATLEIRDANGLIVNQLDLGSMDKGSHPLAWDGKTSEGRQLSEGVFTYNIQARNSDGESIPINLTSKARINGVDIKSKDGALFSDFGKVTFDQIRSVGKVGYDQVETPQAAESNKPAPLEVGARLQQEKELMPPLPDKTKTAAHATESLDRLQAEGKLDIKRPGAEAGKNPEVKAVPPAPGPKSAESMPIAKPASVSQAPLPTQGPALPQSGAASEGTTAGNVPEGTPKAG